jgi:membrane protease YdiL (CAAX protease family)
VVSQRTDQRDAAQTADDYWSQSRRPLASLLFILPLLIAYEAGILVLGRHAVHNGAEVWLRRLLDLVGFGQYLLLPALTVGLLLAWHHLTHDSWRLKTTLVPPMYLESAVLAVALLGIAHLQGALLGAIGPAVSIWSGPARLVSYLGAGIYEELLFRLLMLPAAAALFRLLRLAPERQLPAAVILTSLVFSLAHYVGPESWSWFSFLFRFVAGVFFAVLFLLRGFGIAAGTHALYDVAVHLT